MPAKGMPRAAFNAYRHLIRKDREWLEGNLPLVRQEGDGYRSVGT